MACYKHIALLERKTIPINVNQRKQKIDVFTTTSNLSYVDGVLVHQIPFTSLHSNIALPRLPAIGIEEVLFHAA